MILLLLLFIIIIIITIIIISGLTYQDQKRYDEAILNFKNVTLLTMNSGIADSDGLEIEDILINSKIRECDLLQYKIREPLENVINVVIVVFNFIVIVIIIIIIAISIITVGKKRKRFFQIMKLLIMSWEISYHRYCCYYLFYIFSLLLLLMLL